MNVKQSDIISWYIHTGSPICHSIRIPVINGRVSRIKGASFQIGMLINDIDKS